jgi:hypothetical protein
MTLHRRAARIGIQALVDGGQVALARRIVRELAQCHRRGAAIPPVVQISTARMNDTEVAVLWPYGTAILQVHPDIEARLATERREYPHLPPICGGSLPEVLRHELGHYAHLTYLGNAAYCLVAIKGRLSPLERRAAQQVSRRAAKDPCEFVAEVWRLCSGGAQFPPAVLQVYAAWGGPPPLA